MGNPRGDTAEAQRGPGVLTAAGLALSAAAPPSSPLGQVPPKTGSDSGGDIRTPGTTAPPRPVWRPRKGLRGPQVWEGPGRRAEDAGRGEQGAGVAAASGLRARRSHSDVSLRPRLRRAESSRSAQSADASARLLCAHGASVRRVRHTLIAAPYKSARAGAPASEPPGLRAKACVVL